MHLDKMETEAVSLFSPVLSDGIHKVTGFVVVCLTCLLHI
jgi:hypothetical protein